MILLAKPWKLIKFLVSKFKVGEIENGFVGEEISFAYCLIDGETNLKLSGENDW